MRFRVTKKHWSGLMETDIIEFRSTEDCRRFAEAVNGNKDVKYSIVDYEKVLVGGATHMGHL